MLPANLVLFGLHLPAVPGQPVVLLCDATHHLIAPPGVPDTAPAGHGHAPFGPAPDQGDTEAAVIASARVSSVPLSSIPVSSHEWLSESLLQAGSTRTSPSEATPAQHLAMEVRQYEYLVDQKERAITGDRTVPTELAAEAVPVPSAYRSDRTMVHATRLLHGELLRQVGLGTAPVVQGYARTLMAERGVDGVSVILATPLFVEYGPATSMIARP